MRLTDHRGTSLEFAAARCQFAQLTRAPYDSNWLVIGGRIEKDGNAWKFQDPCLLTNLTLSPSPEDDERSRVVARRPKEIPDPRGILGAALGHPTPDRLFS
jgi:hypothetical protein